MLVGDREAGAALYALLEPHARLFPVIARAVGCLGSNEYYVGRLAGLLGRHDEAVARLRRAVAENDRAGAGPHAAVALLRLGEALADARRAGLGARRPAAGGGTGGRARHAGAGRRRRAAARRAERGSLRLVRGHWLKALGHAGGPLADALARGWRPDRLRRTGFPRRPRMVPGDRLVYYALGWQLVFAVVEVSASRPTRDPSPARWPWTVEVEPLLLVPRLYAAPPVEATGVLPRSMSQQSHIRLTPESYARASRRSPPSPSESGLPRVCLDRPGSLRRCSG